MDSAWWQHEGNGRAVSQLNGGDVVYPVKADLLDSDPRLRWDMMAEVQVEP